MTYLKVLSRFLLTVPAGPRADSGLSDLWRRKKKKRLKLRFKTSKQEFGIPDASLAGMRNATPRNAT